MTIKRLNDLTVLSENDTVYSKKPTRLLNSRDWITLCSIAVFLCFILYLVFIFLRRNYTIEITPIHNSNAAKEEIVPFHHKVLFVNEKDSIPQSILKTAEISDDVNLVEINTSYEVPDYRIIGTVALRKDIYLPMSKNEVFEFFGYSFDLNDVIHSIHEKDGSEYGVYRFSDGSYYSVNKFSYISSINAEQIVDVTICQNQLPVVDFIEADVGERKDSMINGVVMQITQFISTDSKPALFTAQFLYKGNGFFVSAQYISSDTFIAILEYLTSR